jgi:hypothetical protein
MELKFETLRDIELFQEFNIKKKIDFLKYLSQTVAYNREYQILPFQKSVFEVLIDIINQSSNQISVDKELLILGRLLYMTLNNCLIDNPKTQVIKG